MNAIQERPRPVLSPEFCKGCGRCIDACTFHCIESGTNVLPSTGLTPVLLHLDDCTACGLCIDACPEPRGLGAAAAESAHAEVLRAQTVPDLRRPLPAAEPLVIKGMYASAIGAILGGCRHFFGYPITPSTEGAELMARLLPRLNGSFVQAVSEVAAINMMYGAGAAGMRATTFTSSPGFSLMLEGLSYMIGAEVPGVVVNVMRGGPGLGNIAPEQSDIKLACRGLGHGNTHGIVLAPSTPQEMLDFTTLAFDLSFAYRNPVVVLADGYLAQMTGKVALPDALTEPGLPAWAVAGDAEHRRNLISSIFLSETDLDAHNRALLSKYDVITGAEQRADLFQCDDVDIIIVACHTPARMVKGAVRKLRERGVKAGLFRPITLWPFPIGPLSTILPAATRLLVVEASDGQLEDELRLAISRAGICPSLPIEHINSYGGVLPSVDDIVRQALS
jgi:pyruvate/2-oxoacid:ferredoxin oxidoreductase alpha subunit/NAD-dependent dihydropyrimidine dehydrogenase PreA subunit